VMRLTTNRLSTVQALCHSLHTKISSAACQGVNVSSAQHPPKSCKRPQDFIAGVLHAIM